MLKNGEEIIGFNIEINIVGTIQREFDIISSHELIECKNINWEIYEKSNRISHYKQKFNQQRDIANMIKKKFVLYSKNTISKNWKSWFEKKNIYYIEDIKWG